MDLIYDYFSNVFEKWQETAVFMLWLSQFHARGKRFPSCLYCVDVTCGYLVGMASTEKSILEHA